MEPCRNIGAVREKGVDIRPAFRDCGVGCDGKGVIFRGDNEPLIASVVVIASLVFGLALTPRLWSED